MSSVDEVLRRLDSGDTSLEEVRLRGMRQHGEPLPTVELNRLVDGLLARPHAIKLLDVADTGLTDETGVKLARYLAASTSLKFLDLSFNERLSAATDLAVAAALCVNTSLCGLEMRRLRSEQSAQLVDDALVGALRINPNRPPGASLILSFHRRRRYFEDVQRRARQLGHPSLLCVLLVRFHPVAVVAF